MTQLNTRYEIKPYGPFFSDLERTRAVQLHFDWRDNANRSTPWPAYVPTGILELSDVTSDKASDFNALHAENELDPRSDSHYLWGPNLRSSKDQPPMLVDVSELPFALGENGFRVASIQLVRMTKRHVDGSFAQNVMRMNILFMRAADIEADPVLKREATFHEGSLTDKAIDLMKEMGLWRMVVGISNPFYGADRKVTDSRILDISCTDMVQGRSSERVQFGVTTEDGFVVALRNNASRHDRQVYPQVQDKATA